MALADVPDFTFFAIDPSKKRGQVESAGKSRQRVGGESPPHGNG